MYASHTGTKRNLDALRAAGWRLLLNAKGHGVKPEGFAYAIDNGAWHAYQAGMAFDEAAFEDILGRYGEGSDWVAAPDIVGGGLESLALSKLWLPRLDGLRLIPVQDGMTPGDVSGAADAMAKQLKDDYKCEPRFDVLISFRGGVAQDEAGG